MTRNQLLRLEPLAQVGEVAELLSRIDLLILSQSNPKLRDVTKESQALGERYQRAIRVPAIGIG